MGTNSPCRTGCKTRDHGSYAACLRNSNVQVGKVWMNLNKREVRSELASYADARRQGIQPASTRAADIEHAVRRSDEVGYAYDGLGGFKGLEIS